MSIHTTVMNLFKPTCHGRDFEQMPMKQLDGEVEVALLTMSEINMKFWHCLIILFSNITYHPHDYCFTGSVIHIRPHQYNHMTISAPHA
jgi:hypothetical protein